MGQPLAPKNACSYADLAMGVIDKKARSGTIKPNLWWRYRDDIFDLSTQGLSKLIDFTQFINSLYPTIKFTLVHSPRSLIIIQHIDTPPKYGHKTHDVRRFTGRMSNDGCNFRILKEVKMTAACNFILWEKNA